MQYLPEVDLRIAGTGPYEPPPASPRPTTCRTSASRACSAATGLARLFHGARAVVVPSLFPETFGYVVLEAFAVRTPVVVHAGGGALFENGVLSGGGLGYRTDAELLWSIRRIVHDDDLRDELAHAGYARRIGEWSEAAHLDRYFDLIATIRAGRASRGPHLPAPPPDRGPIQPQIGPGADCGRRAGRRRPSRRRAQARGTPARRGPGGPRPRVRAAKPRARAAGSLSANHHRSASGDAGDVGELPDHGLPMAGGEIAPYATSTAANPRHRNRPHRTRHLQSRPSSHRRSPISAHAEHLQPDRHRTAPIGQAFDHRTDRSGIGE